MPLRVLLMSRWKVLPAFHMPKVMQVNSNRPNSVVMAVLVMSAVFIDTWWYPFFRSIFKKWVHPSALVAKSSIFGIEYVSNTLTLLRRG